MAEVAKNGGRKRTHAKIDQNSISAMLFDHEAKIARLGELDTFAMNLKQVQDATSQFSSKLYHLQSEVTSFQSNKDRLALEVKQSLSDQSAKLTNQIASQSTELHNLNETVGKIKEDQSTENRAIKEQLDSVASVTPKIAEVEQAANEKMETMNVEFEGKITMLTSQIEILTAELEAQKNRGFFAWIRNIFTFKSKAPVPVDVPELVEEAEVVAEEPEVATEEPEVVSQEAVVEEETIEATAEVVEQQENIEPISETMDE